MMTKLYLRRMWLSCFLAFLFLKSTAGVFWTEWNRYLFHWSRIDAFAVLLSYIIIAVVLCLAASIVERIPKYGNTILRLAFGAFALFYLKVNIGETLAQCCPSFGFGVSVLKYLLVLA